MSCVWVPFCLTLAPILWALRWAGDLSRVYPTLTHRQLGLAPAKTLCGYRLWPCFSLKSLINIGSRWLQVFWACSSSILFLLYCMSYCFEVLELKQKRTITYENNNKCNDTIQYISECRVIFTCVRSVMIFTVTREVACFGLAFIGPLTCFSSKIWQHWDGPILCCNNADTLSKMYTGVCFCPGSRWHSSNLDSCGCH